MEKSAKISIITVVFNGRLYIQHAVESVLNQSYANLEYIVVDGGSTDGTLDIIKSYGKRITHVISEPDRGMYDALNKGIRFASGDIVGIVNSDDALYDPDVIADIVKEFENNSIECSYGNLIYVDRETASKTTRTWISKPFESGLFEKSWTPAHPTFYCRRELFEKYGYYRLDFKIAADVELMYRFLEKHRVRSLYIPRMMMRMRNAGISNSGISSTVIITSEMKRAIRENGGRFSLLKYLFFKGLKIKQFIQR